MFTLVLTTMFGAVGLVTDIGWAYYRKQVAQAAGQATAQAAVKAALAMFSGACSTGNHVLCQPETSCPSSITVSSGMSNIDKACLYAQTNGYVSTGQRKVTLETGTGAKN